jgi:HlyD family secretion protein
MEIHANIDETDIGEIAVGQPADFTVDAYPGNAFAARVSEIRKAARIVQGVVTYTVILETSNPDGLLLPGMTSTVRIVVEDLGPVATVPLAALRFVPDGRGADSAQPSGNANDQTVWVLDAGGNPQPRSLVLGVDDGRNVAVLGGNVTDGERVITGRAPRPAARRLFGIRF